MDAVVRIIGYMLFAAAILSGAVLAHSDWQQYAASRETAHADLVIRKAAQVP